MELKTVLIIGFTFICTSISLTVEKLSMIWCFKILRQPDVDIATGYLMLLIITVTPSVFSVLEILWNVPFFKKSKESQCPRPTNLILGIASYMIEGACLMFFASTVAPVLPVYILVPLLNGVLSLPILFDEIFRLKKNSQQKFAVFPDNQPTPRYKTAWKIVFSLLVSLLPTVIACLLYISDFIQLRQAICISASLFGLSFVWWPEIRKYSYLPDGKPKKISIFYAGIKVASIIICVAIHYNISTEDPQNISHIFFELIQRFDQLLKWKISFPLILNFSSALLSHALSYWALALSIPAFGLLIPTVASTVVTIALSRTLLGQQIYTFGEESNFRTFLPIAFATFIAFVLWCYPYLLKTSNLISKPPFLTMPFERIFHFYGWDNIFFDQYLILGIKDMKQDENEAEKMMSDTRKTNLSRIFICTTMYREADYEMERLLMSLHDLSTSSKMIDVILEAHIFMDNGCTSTSLNEFAQQLVELTQQKLNLPISDGVCTETPYGIQINWKLPGGMPLYIHFKDSLKIKPKKRWSQAMYFQYILNFRMKHNINKYQMKTEQFRLFSEYGEEKGIEKGINVSSLNLTAFIGMGSLDRNTRENSKDKNLSNLQKSNTFSHNIKKVGFPTLFTNPDLVDVEYQNTSKVDENSTSTFISNLKTSSAPSSFVHNIAKLDAAGSSLESTGILNPAFQAEDIDESAMNRTIIKETSKEVPSVSARIYQTQLNAPERHYSDSDSFSEVTSVSSLENLKDSPIIEIKAKTKRHLSTKTPQIWGSASLPLLDSIETSAKKNRIDYNKDLKEDMSTFSADQYQHSDDIYKVLPFREPYSMKASLELQTDILQQNSRLNASTADVIDESQVYILATDADMEFKDSALMELLHMCNNDKRIGAACGRTHPQAKKTGPIVWHQIFEYAKDFWMIKSAQNVIGSVMCCPGCFSLYRTTAIQEVLTEYTKPTKSPFSVYVKDTGEDRWMATLLMVNGWYLRYSSFARNNTYCPDTFEEFLKQRRRWVLSDITNAVLVVRNLISLIRYNACFSICYVIYMLNMFLNNIITPGTAIVMITAGLDLVFEVPYLYTTIPLSIIVLIYSITCTLASTRTQTRFTLVLTVILGSVFFAVVIWGSATIVRGIVIDIMAGVFHFQQHYIIMLITLSFIYAALMHPSECYMVFYGVAYVFIFPAMHILLPIYSISNIIDQSWGTRDSQEPKKPKKPSIFHCMRRKKVKTREDSSAPKSKTLNAENESNIHVVGNLISLQEGNEQQQKEHEFWLNLQSTLLGNNVNLGLDKADLAARLRRLRNFAWFGLVVTNTLWLTMLSVFYVGIASPLSRLNVFGVISGALYGFTLVIQLIGLTAFRLDYLLRKLAENSNGRKLPYWVNQKEE